MSEILHASAYGDLKRVVFGRYKDRVVNLRVPPYMRSKMGGYEIHHLAGSPTHLLGSGSEDAYRRYREILLKPTEALTQNEKTTRNTLEEELRHCAFIPRTLHQYFTRICDTSSTVEELRQRLKRAIEIDEELQKYAGVRRQDGSIVKIASAIKELAGLVEGKIPYDVKIVEELKDIYDRLLHKIRQALRG